VIPPLPEPHLHLAFVHARAGWSAVAPVGAAPTRSLRKRFRAQAYRLLDRRGGRSLLATLATRRAHRTDAQAATFYDGAWIQRFDDDYMVAGRRFRVPERRVYESQREHCEDFWLHLYHPRPGDVIIDAGAGFGSNTLVFSRAVGTDGRVLAIEAHPVTFGLLEKTVTWNRLANVTLCQRAVMDSARDAFIENRQDHERNTVRLVATPTCWPKAIRGAALDDLCAEHGIDRVAFLKMNVEGAEALALNGMHETIDRTGAVCIACHDFLGDESSDLRTRDRVEAFLQARGFTVLRRQDDPRAFVRDHVHGYRPR
jgi:FkbM family methyltransferase